MGVAPLWRFPFRLKDVAQTFQCLVDSVLRYMPFLFIYLNDILVASMSAGEHLMHLQLLFKRLS